MKFFQRNQKNLGMLLLGIWLIMSGLLPFLHLGFSGLGLIMQVLAIAAGVLLLLGR
jgi:hypothetical protein